MRLTECKSATCGATIFWAVSRNGKRMPMDSDPIADGEFVLYDPDVDVPEAIAVRPGMTIHGEDRYRNHFVTCPDSAQFRRR